MPTWMAGQMFLFVTVHSSAKTSLLKHIKSIMMIGVPSIFINIHVLCIMDRSCHKIGHSLKTSQ